MKTLTITALLALTLVSCNDKAKETEKQTTETSANSSEKMYACPMHPEVTGKKGDTCPKCGMELTEEVKK